MKNEPISPPMETSEKYPEEIQAIQSITQKEHKNFTRSEHPLQEKMRAAIQAKERSNLEEETQALAASLGIKLRYTLHEETQTLQVEVRNPKNDELIRKIPADEMLRLSASIDSLMGLLLNKEV